MGFGGGSGAKATYGPLGMGVGLGGVLEHPEHKNNTIKLININLMKVLLTFLVDRKKRDIDPQGVGEHLLFGLWGFDF